MKCKFYQQCICLRHHGLATPSVANLTIPSDCSAVLLKARKKRPPSDEWLQQLPSKARRLEEGLYLKAQSLEAYLDRTTLKTRLKDLAESIMKDHQEWKRKRLVGPTPNASMSSAASRQAAANTGSRNSQAAPFGQQSSVGQANPMLQQMGRSTAGSQQSTMRQQNDSNASMAPSPYSGRSNSGMGSATSGAPTSGSNNVISELEQQRATNERLQREIEENLRQQNMLLQSQGSGQMGGGMANGMQMPGNSNTTSNMMENNNVGIQGNNMPSNMPMMNNPPMNSNIMMQAALMHRLNTGQLSSNSQFALMQSMAMNGGNSSLGNPLMGAGNQNLLQQAQARFSNQQVNMLRNSVLPGNPMAMGGATSQMGSMNMPGQNGFNPTMPPPSAVQRNAMAGGPRGPNDLGDPSPLSPNSFNW